jgi:hypothetical protein
MLMMNKMTNNLMPLRCFEGNALLATPQNVIVQCSQVDGRKPRGGSGRQVFGSVAFDFA